MRLNWFLKRVFYAPALIEPEDKRCVANSNSFSPSGKAKGRPFIRDSSVGRRVSSLLFWCRPSTVFRGVALFSVYAFERRSGGPYTHILDKVFKIVPSSANTYSLSTVPIISLFSRIIASPHHVFPRTTGLAFGEPVLERVFPTATAFGVSACKILRSCKARFPAVTLAFPVRAFIVDVREFKDHEMGEPFTRKIFKIVRVLVGCLLSHDRLRWRLGLESLGRVNAYATRFV